MVEGGPRYTPDGALDRYREFERVRKNEESRSITSDELVKGGASKTINAQGEEIISPTGDQVENARGEMHRDEQVRANLDALRKVAQTIDPQNKIWPGVGSRVRSDLENGFYDEAEKVVIAYKHNLQESLDRQRETIDEAEKQLREAA